MYIWIQCTASLMNVELHMETLTSSNFTPKPHLKSPWTSLHSFNYLHTFKIKTSSTRTAYSSTRQKQIPKKFQEKDDFPNFLSIHTRNPHAIYKDIQKYANQNKLKEALAILDYLDQRGIPTNLTTFSCLLAACVRLKCIISAKQVHAHIRINGLEKNEFLRTKLVHMYASCGSIEDAKKLFDNMDVSSVYPWNALLRGNVVLGRRNYHEVLGAFSEMRASGVEMNVYSFSCLIKSLAGAKALRQGLNTHALVTKNGLAGSNIVRTSLIDMYFKCGKIKLARALFDEIEKRDVVSWGAMIAGFAHNSRQREALEYVRKMVREGVEVNSVILTSILPVIGEVLARKLGQEAHAYAIKTKEYSKQLFIQSSLVDMYCKCGDIVSGRKVFYGSMERNTISWTALMSGYVTNGRLEQALRSIVWMQQEGFKPDVVTVATILPVCGQLRALRKGKEIHAYAVKNGFIPSVSIATSLMMMYSKCGILEYSLRVFNNMENKNVISWTAMIESYIECCCLHKALSVFRSMQLSKHRPDSVTMSRMLSVCGELRVQKLGREIHGQVLKKDLESIPFVSAELVKMYGNCGAIDKAKLAFDAIPVKGSMTWTSIIDAYGCNGLYEEAVNLFKQMLSNGFSPNQFTFKVVLHICDQAGFGDEACSFFSSMIRKYKIKASEEHYSSIIDLLTRLGRVEEAENFIQLRSSLS